jgi:hypothetical protein
MPYYNWKYAKANGFVKWLFFGDIISTAKALAWPYFELTSRPAKKALTKEQLEQSVTISGQLYKELEDLFMLDDAINLAEKDLSFAQKYLEQRGFRFATSRTQDEITSYDYITQLKNPSIISVSVGVVGANSGIRLIIATVSPRYEDQVAKYISGAIDTSDVESRANDKARIHFLGIYRLNPTRIIKISIREDALPPSRVLTFFYAISDE